MTHISPSGVEILGDLEPGYREILSHDALSFLAGLHRRFEKRRKSLLRRRGERQVELDAGMDLAFPHETSDIRVSEWKVRPAPADLLDRRVEITGPVDRKMVVNALNSGAHCFMADFEDATSPTWKNLLEGQINLRDAVRREIDFVDPKNNKRYTINDTAATLMVRPRGWHLTEQHIHINGEPISASLFDFGLYVFNNHEALKARGTGPYYYLPKIENRHEARLWNLVIRHTEDELGLEPGTVRATVLIETLPATFELDEILYELKDNIVGLNCGRWDYIFSYIKRFRADRDRVLPDRSSITMATPFMQNYARRVIEVCHRRGAHAMGGMSAFIPVRGDAEANQIALDKVSEDKLREVKAGHDGTWVAHPDLVPIAMEIFNKHMPQANQLDHKPSDTRLIRVKDLTATPEGQISNAGVHDNIDVAIRYITAWLGGRGAVPIRNLMEDAATAEISRAQLWQWRQFDCQTSEGVQLTADYLTGLISRIGDVIAAELSSDEAMCSNCRTATKLLTELVTAEEFPEFLTLTAYQALIGDQRTPMRLTEFED